MFPIVRDRESARAGGARTPPPGAPRHDRRALLDAEVLEFATAQGRAVITLNRRHSVKLHQDRPAHAGIVVCSFDRDFAALARRIHEAVDPYADLAGNLIRVNRMS